MNDADRCILSRFVGVRDHTIELVERIPDDLFERTPEGERDSLHWQFVHIADGPDWWLTNVLKDGGTWVWPPPYADSREGVVRGLVASRDRVLRFFEADAGAHMSARYGGPDAGGEWTGRDRALYLTEHEVHHRGRIVLALMQLGFDAFPGEAGENLWPSAAPVPLAPGPVGPGPSRAAVWELVNRLMGSLLDRIERIDELAPGFPDELYEARDTTMEGLMVVDYMERMVRHSRQHREHLASIRSSIGRARPTGPGDDRDPVTGQTYSAIWYQWLLDEALQSRADMAAQLIGLHDDDLDRPPDAIHTAHSNQTIRQVCQHVLDCEGWQMNGIEDGLAHYREAHGTTTDEQGAQR